MHAKVVTRGGAERFRVETDRFRLLFNRSDAALYRAFERRDGTFREVGEAAVPEELRRDAQRVAFERCDENLLGMK